MSEIILFNKPFQVLSQFSAEGDKSTLADFIDQPDYYTAGRLDYDSEGLMILTDNGAVQHVIASPTFKMRKTYWAQVEGEITSEALAQLCQGVNLKDGLTLPAKAKRITADSIWPRVPPVRVRQAIPTSWIELQIHEGRNRQVRRMTAAVGFPTLRLIRVAIGPYSLATLSSPGAWHFSPLDSELKQEVDTFERNRSTKRPFKSKTNAPFNRRRHHSADTTDVSKKTPSDKIPHGKRVATKTTNGKPTRRTR